MIDLSMDIFFMFDIAINFFSAYEVPGGQPEIRPKEIARNYLTSWLGVDLIATMPTDMFYEVFLTETD